MRNAHLKIVRKQWKECVADVILVLCLYLCFLCRSSARMFFGRGAVMAKALGTSPEAEHKLGLHKLAKVRLTVFRLVHLLTV